MAQRSGTISRYNLPGMDLDQKYDFHGGVPINIKEYVRIRDCLYCACRDQNIVLILPFGLIVSSGT